MALKWIEKQYSSRNLDCDVSITLNKSGDGGFNTAFRFRNNTHLQISKTGYVVMAFDNTKSHNRVYFKQSDKIHGFHLTSPSNKGRNVTVKVHKEYRSLIGDYDLLFDEKEKLCYIDLAKKKYESEDK